MSSVVAAETWPSIAERVFTSIPFPRAMVANASFTLDTYTHVTPDMQQEASHIVGGFLENLLGKDLKP